MCIIWKVEPPLGNLKLAAKKTRLPNDYGLNVSNAGNVDVSIYNLMGQIVSTLTEGYLNAGKYTFHWDASQQVSGMYLVRAETAGHVKSQKLALIK